MGRDQIISPGTVNAMIAEGDTIVIVEGYVLRLNSWLHKHPGGRLVISHMVGRDATDEITA
jgi:delta8-fatty-acid desaturase